MLPGVGTAIASISCVLMWVRALSGIGWVAQRAARGCSSGWARLVMPHSYPRGAIERNGGRRLVADSLRGENRLSGDWREKA